MNEQKIAIVSRETLTPSDPTLSDRVEPNRPWYVLQTKPHRQAEAIENAQAATGAEAWAPRARVRRLERGRLVEAAQWLFGTYVFTNAVIAPSAPSAHAGFSPDAMPTPAPAGLASTAPVNSAQTHSAALWHALAACPGIARVLGGMRPWAISAQVVAELRARLDSDGFLTGAEADAALLRFAPGDTAQIVDALHPLNGHSGVVVSAEQRRVLILLRLLGRENAVYVRQEQLISAERAPQEAAWNLPRRSMLHRNARLARTAARL
jgi:transcription antitermination factor NusG